MGRNETDSKKQRDRCTILVTYELKDTVKEIEEAKEVEKSVEEKPKKKILKTNYYYLDESQGGGSEMHLYKADGTRDRMEQR